ncbi:hypothetical protein [Corynebacterium propinquum]|uniref:Uncharacterized protein n=1 Tax=Corynebacterium propinquum TaxID=43769 RepID=A0ABT7G0Q1_9CORY|nr:hypothetical protein [Corynebacterium propinquum]MDK4257108.1 hypothetical protein [Corynebacterium propinquum]MDK4298083.1 hypothetical protein [Corynebacterium propinquum]MDK4300305.1 hypothetical protein [Corynebacterium propinquum]MDK4312940.1 hypothetical protein [Corynebacterium propinquum]WKS32117.1 hypothetical protein NLL45_00345 [Corynebacterium propinquum]
MQNFPLPASAVHISDPIVAERAFSAAVLSLPMVQVDQPQGRHARETGGQPVEIELPVTMTFHGAWRVHAATGVIALLADVDALRPLRTVKISATARISLSTGRIRVEILAPIAPWIVAVNNPEGPVVVGSRYFPVQSGYDMRNYGTSHMYAVVAGTSVFLDGNKLGTLALPEPVESPINVRTYCADGQMVVALPTGTPRFVEIPALAQPLDIYPAAAIVQPLPHGNRVIHQPVLPETPLPEAPTDDKL